MSKVVPYFYTLGTEKFGEFLRTPFNMNMLDNINEERPILFSDWKGREVGIKKNVFTSKKSILTFYNDNFLEITTLDDDKSYVNMKTPFTIGEFITLLYMLNINLFWSDWIEENFEPKDFLPQTRIEDYYADLLHVMDKDHELLTETRKKEDNKNDERL